jgi:ATP-binding cassette subfamily B protein
MRKRPSQIPFVRQMTGTECGAACLAMVLQYHGKQVTLEEVREVIGVNRDGSTALQIVNAGRWYGLRGRGVSVDPDDLDCLDPGTVLFWEFNHFVVYERRRKRAVVVLDPQHGRRSIPFDRFRRAFTGVALLFEPDTNFEPSVAKTRPARRYAREVLRDSGSWTRVFALSLLLQFLALGLPALTGAVIDWVVPRGDYQILHVLGIGMGAIVVFHLLASMSRSHLLLQLRTRVDVQLTLGFVEHLVELPFSFFQQRATGDILMRLNSAGMIRDILTSTVLSTVLDGLLVLLYCIILFVTAPMFGLLVVALGALQVLLFLVVRRKQRELTSEMLNSEALAQSQQVEMLAGMETLKATATEHRVVSRWSDLFYDAVNVSLRRARLAATVDSLSSTLRLSAPLVLLLVGAQRVLSGQMSLGTMMALNALAAGVLGPLANLLGTARQLQQLASYVERLDDILTTAPEQERSKVRVAPTLRGQMQLEDVVFRYSPVSPIIVRSVSMEVQPGQFVGIVGTSGSGKSTLVSLMLGLYPPTSGRVFCDGHDIHDLEARSLRRQIGVVTQRPYLFGTTIRANIALSNPTLPLQQVIEAAKAAQIHDEIMEMPMNYETILFDGASSLSGGQRQRLALARALVGRPAVLVLDEATSALDSIVERNVQQALEQLSCTRIVIAHRLSTVIGADIIFVMDGGRLVESGSHPELLATNGVYARLTAAQNAGRGAA